MIFAFSSFQLSDGPRRAKRPPRRPKRPPRRPQNGPKTDQDDPKTAKWAKFSACGKIYKNQKKINDFQRFLSSRGGPGGALGSLGGVLESLGGVLGLIMGILGRPGGVLDAKMAPTRPQDDPRPPHRRPKTAPRRPQDVSWGNSDHQGWLGGGSGEGWWSHFGRPGSPGEGVGG